MPRVPTFLKYWLPVLVWMAFIYSSSTDLGSTRRMSRIIGPLLRWLVPGISDEAIYRVQFAVRKAGHMTEYAVLALLIWRASRKPAKNDPRPWSWPMAGWAFGGAVLYALSDELHQAFVPSRQAQTGDVLLDTIGAGLGLLGLWWIGRRRKCW